MSFDLSAIPSANQETPVESIPPLMHSRFTRFDSVRVASISSFVIVVLHLQRNRFIFLNIFWFPVFRNYLRFAAIVKQYPGVNFKFCQNLFAHNFFYY
jgi:hypothetical protein